MDICVKNHYINQINKYRKTFVDYTQKKQNESEGPGGGGIRIEFNSETGFTFAFNQKKGGLDLSALPRFQPIAPSLNEFFNSSIPDFGLLVLFTVVALFGAVVGFVRYDMR